MSPKTIIFTKKKKRVQIYFDKERPYFRVVRYELKSRKTIQEYTIFFDSEMHIGPSEIVKKRLVSTHLWEPTPLNIRPATKLFLEYSWPGNKMPEDCEIVVYYETIEKLSVGMPTIGFDRHLEDPRNLKILFSAPFGQGKTTFLKHYFSERETQFNVFKLFPVNYAVASNQDIFKYIKSDILLQLLERKDTDFDKMTVGYAQSFYAFFKNNPGKVLSPFLMTIPKIGKSLHGLYKELDKLKEAFFSFHDKLKFDEAEKASDFINNLIKDEGSIYEDNFFTQLIRNILLQLKERNPEKENVLIIDDLDRMDPDHIFRILNVLSAHYDIFHNSEIPENNKFGFDRIILVGDYDNLKHIYEYRYGPKVDFSGYINKYFSTGVFRFKNTDIFNGIIKKINQFSTAEYGSRYEDRFEFLMISLIQSGAITLREMLKMQNITLNDAVYRLRRIDTFLPPLFTNSAFSPTIYLLLQILNHDILKRYVEELNPTYLPEKNHDFIDRACMDLIFPLGEIKRRELTFKYKSVTYYCKVEENRSGVPYTPTMNTLELNEIFDRENEFDFDDFKDLLILNIDKFYALKHKL